MHADVHLLTGIVFDETGDRMSPTHAKAHGKRYRYYISSRIKGAKRIDNTAWRMPAAELEPIILRFMVKLLGDRSQLIDWIGTYASSADVMHCLDEAAALRSKFANDRAADQRNIIQAMLSSITLSPQAIKFSVNVPALIAMLQSDEQTQPTMQEDQLEPLVAIELPVSIKQRGNEMRLVIHNDGQSRTPDASLVTLVARAHIYLEHLTRAPGISVTDVAKEFGVHRVDVGRILPLAFLAPRLLDQILTGNQSEELSARRLARSNLPDLWTEQLAAFS